MNAAERIAEARKKLNDHIWDLVVVNWIGDRSHQETMAAVSAYTAEVIAAAKESARGEAFDAAVALTTAKLTAQFYGEGA